jgi:hypothetical protein
MRSRLLFLEPTTGYACIKNVHNYAYASNIKATLSCTLEYALQGTSRTHVDNDILDYWNSYRTATRYPSHTSLGFSRHTSLNKNLSTGSRYSITWLYRYPTVTTHAPTTASRM